MSLPFSCNSRPSGIQLNQSGLSSSRQAAKPQRTVVTTMVAFALLAVASQAQNREVIRPNSSSNTPFQHVIVIVQENRTPDNLFQDPILIQRGAHIAQSGSCHGTNITLTPWQLDSCFDMSHAHVTGFEASYDKGLMDGACDVPVTVGTGCTPPTCPAGAKSKYCPSYTYVPNTKYDGIHGILDPYFHLAEEYGFANYMFQTNQGPSFPAHQFLISGTSAPTAYPDTYYDWFAAENYIGTGFSGKFGCIAPAGSEIYDIDPNGNESYAYNNGYPCYEHPTLPDLLGNQNPAITWRYYGPLAGASLWTGPNAIEHICQPNQPTGGQCVGPEWVNDVTLVPGQILTDIGNCQLPQMSWVIPDGSWSDHPGGGTDAGPSWIAAIVNALGQSTCASPSGNWSNTAIIVTWDDWGGFYDDVNPIARVGQGYKNGNGNGQSYVYGFRVPMIVVSAYTKQGSFRGIQGRPTGYISDVNHDFGSILNFVEYVFGENGQSIGTIGPSQFPYADYYAPDAPPSDPNSPYGLSDFFDFTKSHPFVVVQGAKYAPSCFTNPNSCFANFPQPPDNDEKDDDGD